MLGGMAAGEKIPAVEGAAGAMRAASGAWRSPVVSVRGGRSMCCADDCGSGGGVGLAGWGISGHFAEDLLCWSLAILHVSGRRGTSRSYRTNETYTADVGAPRGDFGNCVSRIYSAERLAGPQRALSGRWARMYAQQAGRAGRRVYGRPAFLDD